MTLPSPVEETAYTVTICPTCSIDSALVVLPAAAVYVCVYCGGTGDYNPPGYFNHPHDDHDEEARAKLKRLWQERLTVREFSKQVKVKLASA